MNGLTQRKRLRLTPRQSEWEGYRYSYNMSITRYFYSQLHNSIIIKSSYSGIKKNATRGKNLIQTRL